MTKKMKVLSKNDFFTFKKELVEVEELGGSVWVREPSARSLLQYNEKIKTLQKDNSELTPSASIEIMSLLVSITACDNDGNYLFTEQDVKKLADVNINVLMKLANKALELSGISTEVADEVTAKMGNVQNSSD